MFPFKHGEMKENERRVIHCKRKCQGFHRSKIKIQILGRLISALQEDGSKKNNL